MKSIRAMLLILLCFSKVYAESIKVGILHSLSGTMSISEQSVVDSTLFAIDEINNNGGVLGRKIEPITKDGASNWNTFAKEAENLITKDKVNVVFGCWTSASRKTVKPLFEKYNHLLFYPVQYEGLESSPNIIYTGAAPNQQIIPAVKWAMDTIGKRFYLVGSDYVFPHSANAIMKDQIKSQNGEVLAEKYVLLGSSDVESIVEDIVKKRPDIILNTINGDTNVAFFKALRKRGITPSVIPTISFSIAESELKAMGTESFEGDFVAWNYFQSIESNKNQIFIKAFKKRYGEQSVITDPMEAAYISVHLWAQAVKIANSIELKDVKSALKNLSFAAPEGAVSVDAKSNHIWKNVRIGQIQKDGQFKIIWDTPKPVRPLPYPSYRTKKEWDEFLNALYIQWDKNWANISFTPSKGEL
ncbi:urea ABC transporter substrate-binding protein [Arcobacter lacus]|uniref:Urea ABC transporter substrate-binding protein n=1 Tax=Arcobacter lacus TaxID=1912876 RepID=A0ABX5JFV1_9BACT|nr:urea ABC transporter substrate-binding protein [Arcobacter lacus]PUE65378.1 urea ABC transporter substrate-binding protein [Arcobacter lacus]